jgi:hypothetical protein
MKGTSKMRGVLERDILGWQRSDDSMVCNALGRDSNTNLARHKCKWEKIIKAPAETAQL